MPVFYKRIPMQAHAVLRPETGVELGERLGSGELDIHGQGHMIMAFLPRRSPELWRIQIVDVDLRFRPFRLGRPGEELDVPDLHVTREDFVIGSCDGLFNRETGHVTLHLAIRLSPERVPQLRDLGVTSPIDFTVVEEGEMDFMEGRIIQTHAAPFRIPGSFPEGLLRVRAGQNSCKSIGYIYAAVPPTTEADIERDSPKSVYVCAGHPIILAWSISNYGDVTSAEILGDAVPHVISSAQGSITIPAPATDTTFTLAVKSDGGCESDDYATAYVISSGTVIHIEATTADNVTWSFDYPAVSTDPMITVTSLTTELCLPETTAWDEWACTKIDTDGTIHLFDIYNPAQPTPPVPLAGQWMFKPNTGGPLVYAKGYDLPDYIGRKQAACFDATCTC